MAEVRITGWYAGGTEGTGAGADGAALAWPIASQPWLPCATLASAPLRHACGSSAPAGAHWPAEPSHRAGDPPAEPAATSVRPPAARLLTVTSGVALAPRTAWPTCWRPAVGLMRIRCGRMPAAPVPGSLFPATTTAPPGPAVRPATPAPAPAVVWCQSRPRALENATCDPCTDAATT